MNEDHNKSNDNECFSTTLYSNLRKYKINIYKQDIENFISNE